MRFSVAFAILVSIIRACPDGEKCQNSESGLVSFIQHSASVGLLGSRDEDETPEDNFGQVNAKPAAPPSLSTHLYTAHFYHLRSLIESIRSVLPQRPHFQYSDIASFGENATIHGTWWATSADPLKKKNIWNSSDEWVNFTFWHPSGVISNVNDGRVVWANVNFINIVNLCELSMLAYPFAILPVALFGAVCVGLCLVKSDEARSDADGDSGPPAVPTSSLNPLSKQIYSAWCKFCCALPSLLVFGVPMAFVYISYALPQEVYVIMLMTSSAFVFSNGLHMAFFAPFVLRKIMRDHSKTAPDALGDLNISEKKEVIHWVIFPNYKEDEEIVAAAIDSVARSSLASSNICLLLAMEEREGEDAKIKSQQLQDKFAGCFKYFLTTFHPQDLPNDPPGKASNVAFAFKKLGQSLRELGHDPAKVVLTVADADTEFHEIYFETLTRQYIETPVDRRSTTLWQSAILHIKNYHRQPGPVLVGTMFTSMAELSFLADPNAIRFPYSTYSLSFELARMVGGWDAEWIAEDWHMGIKCFLLTLGRSEVKPVALPTLNYSPEADTWMKTCEARFVQAKRHALGFSDLSYYFMMLPLIFLHLSTVKRKDGADLADFWRLFFSGLAHVVRLVNTHVILGILTLYAVFDMVLKQLMLALMQQARGIEGLFSRTFFATSLFGVASVITLSIVTINFQIVYHVVCDRLEKPKKEWVWLFKGHVIHWVMTVMSFAIWGPAFFLGLAYAVWQAAFKMLFATSFTYEVAAKPTKEQRLM